MPGLESIEWLRVLGQDEWSELRVQATRHEFASGETIFAPTPDPHSVYLLEDGRARILRISRSGDEVTLGYVLAGEVFGELSGFGDYPRESFAVAGTRSVAWRIPVAVFRKLIVARSDIAAEIIRQMGDRMKRVEARVESFVFGDARSRLAAVLLELVEDFGRRDGDRYVIDLGLSQGELATSIGATRQTVNAAMSGFKEDGVLRADGRRTEILDIERLRRIGSSEGG